METIAAGKAKNAFGALLDTAQREPVMIEKNGRPVAVVISKDEFDKMQAALREYRSLKETEYLLNSPKNREQLFKAMKEAEAGDKLIPWEPVPDEH